MKNKNFSNNDPAPVKLDVERKLIPRLRFMGYVMMSMCLISVIYAAIAIEEKLPAEKGFTPPDRLDATTGFEFLFEEAMPEPGPKEVLNFYLVGTIFAFVGAGCFMIAKRKKKTLFQDPAQ